MREDNNTQDGQTPDLEQPSIPQDSSSGLEDKAAGKRPSPPEKSPHKRPGLGVRILRWVTGLAIVFFLGVLAAIFLLYLPMRDQVQQYQENLSDSNSRISTLQDEISSLTPLKDTNASLEDERRESEVHIALLSARADVASARLALAQEDTASALAALSKTPQTLKRLADLLPDQSEFISNQEQRLSQAIVEIETDTYAAASDLDVLATNLLKLENTLFTSR